MQWLLCFASLAAVPYLYGRGTHSSAQQAASSLPPPVHLAAEQDHQRLMDLLHITSLRRGPDGDPNSPNSANYDESKVAPPQPTRCAEFEQWQASDLRKNVVGSAPPGNRRRFRPRNSRPRSEKHAQSKLGSDQHRQRKKRRRA